ncbi:MAG: Stp1/IreP family PP2C-type Ser/Thr phosphatase [Myxococcota bacterium]|nr:Stp1/IreP family PP2C-type Ser/Thr phosphatase [Myxococcota bacterium]
MILRAAAGTDVGRRRAANEDHYALAPEIGLYLVADGLGGHVAGQVASELAAEASLRAVRTLEGAGTSLAEKLRYAVIAANREVHETARQRRELAGMGTTLVAVLAQDGRAALAHVGDSRAYLVRGGRIRQLTDDHSLVGELVRRREISADAAREHPQRHVLTRAVGVRPSVEPDLAELTPEANDVFVLCSDGLTGHVRDEEIARCVTEVEDPQQAIDQLIALANQRGGDDNITVVVARCEKDDD